MTEKELQNMAYIICCPMCDNLKCVRGTEACEAMQWIKEKMTEVEKDERIQ